MPLCFTALVVALGLPGHRSTLRQIAQFRAALGAALPVAAVQVVIALAAETPRKRGPVIRGRAHGYLPGEISDEQPGTRESYGIDEHTDEVMFRPYPRCDVVILIREPQCLNGDVDQRRNLYKAIEHKALRTSL